MRRKMDGWPKGETKKKGDKTERQTNDGLDPIRDGRAGRARVSGRASAREESHYPKAAAAALPQQKRKNRWKSRLYQ